MATLEQERAAFAWENAQEAHAQGFGDPYTKLAKGAPALIMNNGLMQTLAFYAHKADWDPKNNRYKKPHFEILNRHILGWLHGRNLVSAAAFAEAMSSLHQADSADYRRATEEAMALLKWIRQFAPAIMADA